MTVTLGRIKRGDDKTFRAIAVTVGGAAQDLTAEGWTVAAQARPHASSETVVDFDVDVGELASSRVVLSLDAATSTDMAVGTWVGDVQITSPDGVQSSETFHLLVVADVTREVAA